MSKWRAISKIVEEKALGTRLWVRVTVRLDFQPLFWKGARAPSPKSREERKRQKSSLGYSTSRENEVNKITVLLRVEKGKYVYQTVSSCGRKIDQSEPVVLLTNFYNCDYSVQEKYGPVGLLHLDAHPDTSETTFGEKISNATPFRRAVEEGLLDCQRVVQIGLRGTGNSPVDYEFGRSLVSFFI